MQLIVDQLGTEYKDSGKGKVVLLLHGWGEDQETFASLRTELSKVYRVVSLDLPGFGKTDAPRLAWDLDDYGQFIGEFIKAKKLGTIHAVIGYSNGGAIAVRSLAKKYFDARKLVLLAAAGVHLKPQKRRLVLKTVAKAGKKASSPLSEITQDKLRQKLHDIAAHDRLNINHQEESYKKTAGQDVQDDARNLTQPTLLLYGEQDLQDPPVIGEALHNVITGSTLEILGGQGHDLHQTDSGVIAQTIKKFIK